MASIISAGTTSGTALNMAGDTSGVLQLATNGSTTAVTVDASQNVGIGTTSPSVKLDVSAGTNLNLGITQLALDNYSNEGIGITFSRTSSDDDLMALGVVDTSKLGMFSREGFVFATGGATNYSETTERMRIDSSGNVLVGGTSQSSTEKFSVQNSTNVMSAFIRNTRATTGDITLALWSTATRDANSFIIQGLNSNQPGSGQVFNVYTNGNVQNANNSYGAISDIKLKENIVDATPKLDDLCKVKVRQYNLIGDELKQIGVIAQELETVFPKLIDESVDKDTDGNDLNTTTKSVKYSVFVPILIKAIQEQQTIINDLKARITALEGAA